MQEEEIIDTELFPSSFLGMDDLAKPIRILGNWAFFVGLIYIIYESIQGVFSLVMLYGTYGDAYLFRMKVIDLFQWLVGYVGKWFLFGLGRSIRLILASSSEGSSFDELIKSVLKFLMAELVLGILSLVLMMVSLVFTINFH